VRNINSILDDIDCLIPLITYLGSNPYWWARSAPSLSVELALDAERVQAVFDRYPMIFRKSRFINESNAHSYALQMRYARRQDGDTDHPPKVSYLPPLSSDEVIALIDFLVRISTLEKTVSSSRKTMIVAVVSAIISATAAIAVSLLHGVGT